MSGLPNDWEEHVQGYGSSERCYFVRLGHLRESTWVDPRRPINTDDPLPMGWDCRADTSVRWFYFNKLNRTATYEDPRLPPTPAEQLPRGNVLSDLWFYGQVPPAASKASDRNSEPQNTERPLAYSVDPDPIQSQIASHLTSAIQLPHIQHTKVTNIRLRDTESLLLQRHQSSFDPEVDTALLPLGLKHINPTTQPELSEPTSRTISASSNNKDDLLATSMEAKGLEKGGSSTLAKNSTPELTLGKELQEVDRTMPSDPNLPPRIYKLVGANRGRSGTVRYDVISAKCRAEQIASHIILLHWDNGNLHHHAFVDGGADHVRTSENKLNSWCDGLEALDDVWYLIIEFTNRDGPERGPVDYTNSWADLFVSRTFEDAIRIGWIIETKSQEGCQK